jgi:hypothetical protein
LAVPFKFQLTGAHQLTGSASVGPYLGYRWATTSYGWALTTAAFAGVSNVSTSKTSGSKAADTTDQNPAFSYGGALLVEVKGGFQAGAVLGVDSIGSGNNFHYNNRPWLAFQIGYSFTQQN